MSELFPISPGVVVDVDKAKAIVAGRKPNARVCVATVCGVIRRGFAAVNRNHVYRGKLQTSPCLIARVGGIDVLFDGYHRCAYARWKKTRKYLPAYRLTERELRSCVTPERFVRL